VTQARVEAAEAAERTRADGKQRVAELTEELAESERTRAALAQTVCGTS
jgi:hypothetical protein